jgi:hypothetical protein
MKALFLFLAAAAAFAPLAGGGPALKPTPLSWPARFEGRPILPMVAAPEDALLARGFPGHVARFSDGRRQIVLRQLGAATRRLHPASDCFRAIGYDIEPAPMRLTPDGAASCFTARRGERTLRACERIRDSSGASWPDISSWYWAALLGHGKGPWLASLTVEQLAAE